MSTVFGAQGTTLGIDEVSGASNSFSIINNVTSLTGVGGGTVTQQRTTALAGTVHVYRPTIKDPAEVSFDLWFDPTDAVHKFVRNLADTPTNGPNNYLATYNTPNINSTCQFTGNVSEWSGYSTDDVEANLMATFTVKQTGLPTWVNAT